MLILEYLSDTTKANEAVQILAKMKQSKSMFVDSVVIVLSIYFFGILKCDPFPALT
jgi:predicted nucleic-acid-binding protein